MLLTNSIFWLISVPVWVAAGTATIAMLRLMKKAAEQKSQKQLKRVPIRKE